MLFPLFSDEDVSTSVATGFQQLTIYNEEEQEALPKEEKHAVIIPNHLQVHTSECLHLMFGCFSSGIGSGQPSALNDNLEEPLVAEDDSSFRHPDTNFYGEEEAEQPRNAVTNEQVSYQIDSSTQNYNSATDSKTDAVQHEPPQEVINTSFRLPKVTDLKTTNCSILHQKQILRGRISIPTPT